MTQWPLCCLKALEIENQKVIEGRDIGHHDGQRGRAHRQPGGKVSNSTVVLTTGSRAHGVYDFLRLLSSVLRTGAGVTMASLQVTESSTVAAAATTDGLGDNLRSSGGR